MKYKIALLLMSFLAFATTIKADGEKDKFNPVSTAVNSLKIGPDARAGGLGDIGAATDPDVNSQAWNPAKYPFCISRAGIAVNYTPWLRKIVNDIDLAYVAGYMRLGDYTAISSSLRYFSLGEVDAGENMSIKPYEMAFDIGVSRMLSENFSAAIALRYIRSDLSGNYSDDTKPGNAFAADVAMYYNKYVVMGSRECQLGLGLNISNIGSKMKFGDENTYFIPTNLRLGVNYLIPINEYNKIAFGLDLNKLLVPTMPRQKDDESGEDYQQRLQKDYFDMSPITGIFKSFGDAPGGFSEELKEIQWSFGVEYTYNDKFILRAGYHDEDKNKGNRKYFTVGAGFRMNVFSIDAGYVLSTAASNPLDQTLRVSLAFDFDGIKDLFSNRR
ncbi:MAG: type IX secretion system outer membrane channel protein PorV [Bacteroidaceae bacterium]|nr:type IX secretion system outer membrane channel protein PorV [Bacteroidaceae bacterium]